MAKDWSIKNIYYYLVCLVTLFLIVGGTISVVGNAVQIIYPDQPNVMLMHVYYPEFRETTDQQDFDPPPLTELEQRRAEQEQMQRHYLPYHKRSLLNSIALVLIATPFYLYHWKIIRPETQQV